mmetsp:Transcript_10750/g.16999  ORF Transcript_10750/g.16999 Transcript_10750/m.16999 type:complete len:237 (-) Transcript_10750:308-1018(-)
MTDDLDDNEHSRHWIIDNYWNGRMSCNRASPALIPQLSSYLIIRPFFSLENVYTVCPRKRIRGAQGSFSLPSISHSATICDCASLRSRENNLVLGLSTRASITGRKLARLRSNVWTPMIALSYCKCSNIDILQYTSFPLPQFKKEIVAFVASTLERERWVGEQAVPIVHARCEFSRPEIISFIKVSSEHVPQLRWINGRQASLFLNNISYSPCAYQVRQVCQTLHYCFDSGRCLVV